MEQIPKEVAWLVSIILIEAAVIDGRSLRVPNWLTFHFLAGGLIFAFWKGGSALLLTSTWRRGRGPDDAFAACTRSAGWGPAM